MDLLTREDLVEIARPTDGGTHVSLFLPTHRAGNQVEADRLRFKNMITRVEEALAGRERRPDIDRLLAPAWELHDDALEWQYMSDGLAMFLGPGGSRAFRVPAPMSALATVGDHPVLAHLLRLFSGDEHFFLLALSQREVRLLGGSRNKVEEVELPDAPRSVEDVSTRDDPGTSAIARQVAGRGAVFFGHGGSDDNVAHEELMRFLRAVADGVHGALRDQHSPLVLVGLENLRVPFREANRYPHLMAAEVDRSADGLSRDELHALAWPLVEEQLRADRARRFGRFHELQGTGLVSTDLEEVARAASEGRVETLFVRADPWAWDLASEETDPVVRLGADERFATAELVDAAAVATIRTGGQVYASAQTAVADSEVAAIFRY